MPTRGSLRICCAAFCATTASAAFLAPVFAHADIVISEVAFDPLHADDKHEWIELHNDGASPIDIAKWTFSDGSSGTKHQLNAPPKNGGTGTLTIAPGAYLVIADDATTFIAEYPGIPQVVDSTMNLPNPSLGVTVSVVLYDDAKRVVDTFDYVGGNVQKNTGDSVQRAGGRIIGAAPTPGAPNATEPRPAVQPVPAPAKASRTASAAKPAPPAKSPASVDSAPAQAPPPEVPEAASKPIQQAAVGDSAPGSPLFLWASVLLSVAAAGAAISARAAAEDEWEIEEAGDTV